MKINSELTGVLGEPKGAASFVKRALSKRGMCVNTLATEMDIDLTAVNEFLEGSQLSAHLAEKLSKTLNVSAEMLLKLEELKSVCVSERSKVEQN